MKKRVVSSAPIPKLTEVNVATNLALRFLLPADAADQADALEHLIALCLRALHGLYLIPADTTCANTVIVGGIVIDPGASCRAGTREFVADWLTADFFGPHYSQTAAEIDTPANRKKFRYVGNACRSAVKDEYRRRKAAKRGGGVQDLTLDEAYHETYGARDKPTLERLINSEIHKLARTPELEQALGAKPAVTLRIILTCMAEGWIDHEGAAAKAVAAGRGVTVQQARADIRDLAADIATLKAATGLPRDVKELLAAVKTVLTPVPHPSGKRTSPFQLDPDPEDDPGD